MKGIYRLREQLHSRLLQLHKMERLICGHLFERLYEDSNEEELEILKEILKGSDVEKLKTWMRRHSSLELGEKNVITLKEMAKNLGVRNYSRMSKLELIKQIQSKEQQYEED